ncbi:MAG: hypothetical protein KF914_11215 [Rhizobiaceae bacterium]|nr:hypothetical protein [Rhizobiaceae bacterium]
MAARRALLQAAWPTATVLALAAFAVARCIAGVTSTAPFVAMAFVTAVLPGLLVLALSAILAFDALLFRVAASYEDEMKGGAAVDDILARMRLKPAPAETRSLADRIAGTERLIRRQRAALAALLAGSLIVVLA